MTLSPTGNPLPGGHTGSWSPSQWHLLLCGSLGALWSLVASPTHRQRGHLNRQGPCPETGIDGIKSKMRLSYLLYIAIGNWFWQGTCRVRTWMLGEDAFALFPPTTPPSPVGTAVPRKGCTGPVLTQHCPGPKFFNPPHRASPAAWGDAAGHQPQPCDDSHDTEPGETSSLPVLLGTTVTAGRGPQLSGGCGGERRAAAACSLPEP